MFLPDLSRYREPVLVASTDGVGTKIQVAILAGVHDTVGYDLVAHCVNDILVQGAVPLFFLDYIALGRMDPDRVEAIVSGFARGCSEFGCPLLGGETAEMPGTYAPGDYDLAGFIVGVVERERALTGAAVQAGDTLVGLPSAGLHTNGYTLARKVLFETLGYQVSTRLPELGQTVGEALLAPHRSYLAALEPLLERRKIRALAHITGGGFAGNIPRVLPEGLGARIRRGAWEVPPLFRLIQKGGDDLRRRDAPHLQHGRRHDRGGGAGGPARRRAFARAPRRSRLRHRHRRGRRRRCLRVNGGKRRRPHQRARHATCRP